VPGRSPAVRPGGKGGNRKIEGSVLAVLQRLLNRCSKYCESIWRSYLLAPWDVQMGERLTGSDRKLPI